MIGYGGLCAALIFGFVGGMEHLNVKGCVWAAVIATVYGVTDEWHQSFINGRTADPLDLVADGLGAIIAACAYLGLIRLRFFKVFDLTRFHRHLEA